jgi:hypothetical protein
MEKTLISYRATRTVLHGRVKYGPNQPDGDTVKMTAKEAAPLIALGALASPEGDEETPPPTNLKTDKTKVEGGAGGGEGSGGADGAAPAELAGFVAAIKGLDASGFGSNGKPKVDAINAALGADAAPISGAVRDAVWADLEKAGFKAPENEA